MIATEIKTEETAADTELLKATTLFNLMVTAADFETIDATAGLDAAA